MFLRYLEQEIRKGDVGVCEDGGDVGTLGKGEDDWGAGEERDVRAGWEGGEGC